MAARAPRRARARRVPRLAALAGARARASSDSAEDELAAYTVAFVSLLLVAAGTALVSPYSLVFVLPSLYTWLWLPQLGRTPDWVTDVLFGAGLVGPVLALVVLAEQLDLGDAHRSTPPRSITTGVIPWGATLALTVWAAIAGLVGAVASGNYAPHGAVEGQVASPRSGGELARAARNVDECVRSGRAGDHVRLLSRERREQDVVSRSLDRRALEVVARGSA